MKKIPLSEQELPRTWYNILPDLPDPLKPPLNPATGEPIGPEQLAAIFPMPLLEQEVSPEPEIPIPEEILDVYAMWRPTPLFRFARASFKSARREVGEPAGAYSEALTSRQCWSICSAVQT